MRAVMFGGAVLAFTVAGAASASIRSDIQIMIALLGIFAGLIMLGIASVLHRLKN